ncbi:MAG: hypothetical protein ACI9SI_001100, partial [Polaribacter sp.]
MMFFDERYKYSKNNTKFILRKISPATIFLIAFKINFIKKSQLVKVSFFY